VNWLDWLIIAFVAVSIIGGWKEGFIRLGIGFIALIVGFIGAAWFYGLAADPLLPYVKSKALANVFGFQIIFFGVLIAGGLLAALIARVFKLVGLSFVDRLLGAGFGAVRGAVVVIVVTLCVMAFAPRSLPAPVETSQLAPYIVTGSRVLSSLTPYELKHGFNQTFDNIQGIIKGLHRQTLPVRQE
jgi:membrane protein required for colicin V production